MNKLSKAKRDQLILVGLGTGFMLILIGFGLIRSQYATLSGINSRVAAARSQLDSMQDAVKKAANTSSQVTDLTATLAQTERDLASGDPAQWIYNSIRNFKEHYQVDVAVTSQLSVGEVNLLPHFPYRQIQVTVGGKAYFHDLGKFISDFENTFPHARITNLNLEPDDGTGKGGEKLAFRMELIVLTNPNAPQG
jgi:hypothetical protein